MIKETISLKTTHRFTATFLSYIAQENNLNPFYNNPPTIDGISNQIKERLQFPISTRKILHQSLKEQYSTTDASPLVSKNIDALLSKDTFTVTTGHQLNLCTGPLYFIYKIITTINITKELKKKHPQYNFVPIYWMASEDHDIDEIKFFNFFGKKYVWNTQQKGAIGSMSTEGISKLLEELPERIPLFDNAYKEKTLSDAVRNYVNQLFGMEGLIVLDSNTPSLKQLFSPIIKKELQERQTEELVQSQTQLLKDNKYDSQVTPRNINLFYLDDQIRERIEYKDHRFYVLNTDLSFSEEEILTIVQNTPEKFSPNVILRPVYQEFILPNLSYVGGPSEIIYWLQLGKVFENYQISFPVLIPRNFVQISWNKLLIKWKKMGLHILDLFKDIHQLKKQYISSVTAQPFNLGQNRLDLKILYENIKDKICKIDGSLDGWAGAEHKKAEKNLDHIEKRMKKLEEQKHEQSLRQIEKIQEKHFPSSVLQERFNNFFEFQINHPSLLQELLTQLDPFCMEMHFFELK